MKRKIRRYIRMVNILNDNKNIEGNFILWSFIKLFTSIGRLNQAAAALTYHTLFAIVPIMALFLATASFLGYGDAFKDVVESIFAGQEALSREMLSFSESYIKNANNGYWYGAVVGLGFLLYSLFSIFVTIDDTFNSLWNLKGHSIKKLLKVFFFTLLLPIVAVLFLAIRTGVISYFDGGILHEINFILVTTAIYILLLFALYKYVPKVHVMNRYAAISAGVCGATFALMQYFAAYIIRLFNGLNNIYGDLAGILIMLLWIYFSWIICLIGSRWNFLLQESKLLNQKNKFKAISHNYRKFLTLLVLAQCEEECEHNGSNSFDAMNVADMMVHKYNIPTHITMDIIEEITHIGIVIEDEEENTMIRERFRKTSINDLIEILDTTGYNDFAAHITDEAHSNGKERELWLYINEKRCTDTSNFDVPLSQLLQRNDED